MSYVNYICQKPLVLFGKQYNVGDVIPYSAIVSNRVRSLSTMGYIKIITRENNKNISPKNTQQDVVNKNISE
jgi:hypothetical protein|nr:MAG TPA: hypothetical protein [Caudoviricetes sp.]